jgi:MoaA/NifB/PqqE/SkfB family radical SAM enzyme
MRSDITVRPTSLLNRAVEDVRSLVDSEHVPPPKVVYVGVNSVCNLRCVMCDVGQGDTEGAFYKTTKGANPKAEMRLETFRQIVDEVAPYGTEIRVNLMEPLLWPHLPNAVEYAKRKGLSVSVTTNGWLLEREIGRLAPCLNEIIVSIDGVGEVHDRIRGVQGAYQRAMAGILEAQAMKVRVTVACCISADNCDNLALLAVTLESVGIKSVVFGHLNFVTPYMAERHNISYAPLFGEVSPSASLAKHPTHLQLDTLEDQIRIIRRRHPSAAFIPNLTGGYHFYYNTDIMLDGSKCVEAWRGTQVLADGRVVVTGRCCFSELVLGNVNEEPLMRVWNGERYRKFRRDIARVKATPACARCCAVFGGMS